MDQAIPTRLAAAPDDFDGGGGRPALEVVAGERDSHPPLARVDKAHLRSAVKRELRLVLLARSAHDVDGRLDDHCRVVVRVGVEHTEQEHEGQKRGRGGDDCAVPDCCSSGDGAPHDERA